MSNTFTIAEDLALNYAEVWTYQTYELDKVADTLNYLTFFVADDDIDIKDLQRYAKATHTEYLIAINATGKTYDCLKIADNIVYCLPNEIEMAISVLGSMPFTSGAIGIDWNDIATVIANRPNIRFIQSRAVGKNYVNQACDDLILKYRQIQSDEQLAGVMVNTIAGLGLTFDQLDVVIEKTEKNLGIDEGHIFYQINFSEEFDGNGCCICMYLTYCNGDTAIKPMTTPEDTNIKSTSSSQKIGNSIQDYLRKQRNKE